MRVSLGSRGYTIVEVMMFLAISGFMFVIAAGFLSGKQATAEFKQGMSAMNDQIKSTINDVANGVYPGKSDFSCTSSGGTYTWSTGTPNTQGQNKGCVFVGKILFFPGANLGAGRKDIYKIETVAGTQFVDSALTPPRSYNASNPSNPVVVNLPNTGSIVDLTETKTMEWGLKIKTATTTAATPNDVIGIGFYGSPAGSVSATDSSTASGSQTVHAAPLSSMSNVGGIKLHGEPLDTTIATPRATILCFDGGSGKYGSITIGGSVVGGVPTVSGSRLGTSMKFGSTAAEVGCP